MRARPLLIALFAGLACVEATGPAPMSEIDDLRGFELSGSIRRVIDGPESGLRATVRMRNTTFLARDVMYTRILPLAVRFYDLNADTVVACEPRLPCDGGIRLPDGQRIRRGETGTLTHTIRQSRLDSLVPGTYRVRLMITTTDRPEVDVGLLTIP